MSTLNLIPETFFVVCVNYEIGIAISYYVVNPLIAVRSVQLLYAWMLIADNPLSPRPIACCRTIVAMTWMPHCYLDGRHLQSYHWCCYCMFGSWMVDHPNEMKHGLTDSQMDVVVTLMMSWRCYSKIVTSPWLPWWGRPISLLHSHFQACHCRFCDCDESWSNQSPQIPDSYRPFRFSIMMPSWLVIWRYCCWWWMDHMSYPNGEKRMPKRTQHYGGCDASRHFHRTSPPHHGRDSSKYDSVRWVPLRPYVATVPIIVIRHRVKQSIPMVVLPCPDTSSDSSHSQITTTMMLLLLLEQNPQRGYDVSLAAGSCSCCDRCSYHLGTDVGNIDWDRFCRSVT